jgi:hypothetical protein
MQVSNTKAYLANTNSFIKAQLANTNSSIASRATWTALKSTNTAIRSYVDTSVSAVVNAAPGTLNTLRELATALANDANFATTTTNLIATKISVANTKAYLANTNAYIATRATWSSVTGTNTALRTLINDRLQVANAAAIYQTKEVERAALANTNARINLLNTNLTGTNTALRALISSSGGSLVTTTTATVKNLTQNDTVITGVTAAVATGYLQVSNAVATYTTKAYAAANSYVKSTLANTNAYIATRATWTALTATNTAIRALDTAKLSVANAVSTYATKASPTTSGLLAHTGRATVSTNLTVTGNTTVSTHIITPNRHGFRVYGSGTTNNLTTTQNGDGKLNNNNFAVDYNQGNCLHANTGVFTARVAGLYQICQNVRNSGYASGISQLICYKNKGITGEAVMVMTEFGSSSSMNHAGGSTVAYLNVNDTLSIRVGAGQVNFDGNDNWSVTHLG